MSVPGGNLLGMASRLIKQQKIDWRRNRGMSIDPAGYDLSNFDPPVTIAGSVQPVPRSVIVREGLDLEQSYLTVYTKQPLQDLKRDKTPDLLIFGGRTHTVEANTNWKLQDGWIASLVVDVGPAA